MNNRKCFRCSFIERAEADCPACHGTNRIFGKCFKCPVCEGYGKWCSICDYKGYLKEKYIKCPNCKGKTSCIQCPVCHDKLIIPDTDSTIFVLELSPRSHPSKDTIKRFIFFKNCRHFDNLREKIINTKNLTNQQIIQIFRRYTGRQRKSRFHFDKGLSFRSAFNL